MIGRQVNFFFTPSDMAECEGRIRRKVKLIVLERYPCTSEPTVLTDTSIAAMGETALTVCLAPPDELKAVRVNKVKAQQYFAIDLFLSPVIELNRCFFDGVKLRRGRLYYIPNFYDEANRLVPKDATFLDWAKRVFAATKSGLKFDRARGAYLGAEAAQLVVAGTCRLVD